MDKTYDRLLGEFIGILKGLLWWDLPEELEEKIRAKIKELEKILNPFRIRKESRCFPTSNFC